MKHLAMHLLIVGLFLGGAVRADPPGTDTTQPNPQPPIVNPTSGFPLPQKPPPPTGHALTMQILLALFTVGGCTAAGATLVLLDAKYESSGQEEHAAKLQTVRAIEHGFLGVIVVVGGALLFYAGIQLFKSAGLLK